MSSTPIIGRPVPELLDEAVRRFGRHWAIDFLGRRWRYEALGRLVDRAARGLQDLGVGSGVKVGLCLPNTPYSVILYFAILKAGGTVVNFNPLYTERELQHQIDDSDTTLIAIPDVKLVADKVLALAPGSRLRRIIVCPMAGVLPRLQGLLFPLVKRREIASIPKDARYVAFRDLIRHRRPSPVEIDPATDIAVLQYTGGTTGVPKGAMLTHANLTVNAAQVVDHLADSRMGEERILGVLPLFHVFAMTCVMNVGAAIGAEMILLPRFHLEQALATIERTKPTFLPGVPTLFNALATAAEKAPRNLSSVRLAFSGGAPLPAEVRARFETATGCRLFEGYGLSETGPVATINPPCAIKNGSAGIAIKDTVVEIREIANPRRIMATGERGEVSIRGPQVMAGYWNRPLETDAAMVDGAFRTGDVGYLDEDGYLFLVDRIKDIIISGGFNIYPYVIEAALYQHPAVHEAVVVGIPDAYRGEVPKGFVTLREGKSAAPEEIRAFLAGYVSSVEMPREIEIRESLPRTSVGKLSRKELAAEARAAAAASNRQSA